MTASRDEARVEGDEARVASVPWWAADGAVVLIAGAMAATASIGGDVALGMVDPFSAFDAQAPGGRAMLAVRVLAFGSACVRVPLRERRAMLAVSALGALFVASLAACGLALVFVLATAFVIVRFARPAERRRDARSRAWSVAALVLVPALAFAAARPRERPPSPRFAGDVVADWRARDNLFRARAVALDWAKHETPPGEAHLALASIDWDLGHGDLARKVLSRVIAQPASDDVKRRADDLSRAWGDDSR